MSVTGGAAGESLPGSGESSAPPAPAAGGGLGEGVQPLHRRKKCRAQRLLPVDASEGRVCAGDYFARKRCKWRSDACRRPRVGATCGWSRVDDRAVEETVEQS